MARASHKLELPSQGLPFNLPLPMLLVTHSAPGTSHLLCGLYLAIHAIMFSQSSSPPQATQLDRRTYSRGPARSQLSQL